MVHDRIGVGVPVRVFVGSAGENAYRIVRKVVPEGLRT